MIKKGRDLLCTRAEITCRVIQKLQQKACPVAQACRGLHVSRAGYDQHMAQDQAIPDLEPRVRLRAAFTASGRSDGRRRQAGVLQNQGLETGRCKVRTLMRKKGTRPVWKRRLLHTTDRRHDRPAAESLLGRRFNPGRPNQARTSAIPYLRTQAGGRYPAAIDLDARRIAGRVLAPHLRTGPVAAARQTALRQRQPGPGLRLHADRGSPYAGGADQPLRARHDIMCRMRRKGGCRDHAAMTRVFLNLEMERRVWRQAYASLGEAQRDIAAYIVGFYNCVRLHPAPGNLLPVAFAQLKTVKQPVRASEIS